MRNSIQLEIPKPCHEDWSKMTPEAKGRFCGSCQKTVVDFSLMSDQQVLGYFSRTHGNICGRFANDQLGRSLEEGKQVRKSKWRFVLNLIVPAFLISGKVYSQGGPMIKVCTQKIDKKNKNGSQQVSVKKETISPAGTVIDDLTGFPIPAASIRLIGGSISTTSNENGEFSIGATPIGENKLEISCIGYETLVVNVPLLGRHITYRLQQEFNELEPITITGFGATKCSNVTVGAVATVRSCYLNERPVFTKIKDSLQLLTFKKSIKVYPNPMLAGSQFFLDFKSENQGVYNVEIIDASGRVLQTQQINIVLKKQTISLSTIAHWAKGMYWVRITGCEKNSSYTGKFFIR